MQLFRYIPDPDRFRSFQVPSESAERVVSLFFEDRSVAQSWAEIDVVPVGQTDAPTGDFPCLNNYGKIPLCSTRAWSALKGILQEYVEPLPLRGEDGSELLLLNVMVTIDAIDLQRSEFSVNAATGRVDRIYKCVFKEQLVSGKPIFKTPLRNGAELFVSEEFRIAVESHRLDGLLWKVA